jgi:hypothetical protein
MVAAVIMVAPTGTVPSPHFNYKPRIMASVDLLPEVDRGSIVKVGLEWILALMPCPRWLRVGCCTFCSLLPRADMWPSLR